MTKTTESKTTEWMETTKREAAFRRGLVLHGNTRDLFSRGGASYATLPELLWQELEREFTVRAVWDGVDGLRFASTKEAERWRDAVRRGVDTPASTASRGEPYDDGGKEPASAQTRISLDETLAAIRCDAQTAAHEYLKDTQVPHGGE